MTMNMRLVAYAPNGARMGDLPQPIEWSFSDILNDVSSLTFKYSERSARFELLANLGIEIAVEYSPDGAQWVEANNGRVLLLQDDFDPADEGLVHSYTCPGYGWSLGRAVIHMTAAQRSTLGKRRAGLTVGQALGVYITEAKARGTLSSLTYTFTNTHDSNGEPWAWGDIDREVPAGTSILQFIKDLSDSGMCDWRMEGRQLRVFNPAGEMGAPRASRRLVQQGNDIHLLDLVEAAYVARKGHDEIAWSDSPLGAGHITKTNVTSALRNGAVVDPRKLDGISMAADAWSGRPTMLFQENVGQWNPAWQGNQAAWDKEWQTCLAFADAGTPIHTVIVVPAFDDSRMDLFALEAYLLMAGVAVIINPSSYPLALDNYNSIFSHAGAHLASHGVNIIELYAFDEMAGIGDSTAVIAHKGETYHPYAAGVRSGLLNRPEFPSNKIFVTKAITSPYPMHMSVIGNSARPVRWFKVGLKKSVLTSENVAAIRREFAIGMVLGYNQSVKGAALAKVQPKPKINWSEPYEPPIDQVGPVEMRLGREITEAPTTRSLADLTGIVFAYGDSFVQTRLDNLDRSDLADRPWGTWETALSVGGVTSITELERAALPVIDQGISVRNEFTRGFAFLAAKWVPWRDFDTGDYILGPDNSGQMIEMRVQQVVASMKDGAITGSLVMNDRFLPTERKIAKAVVAASGGAVGGYSTAGSVRAVAPVIETRKPKAPT